NQLLNIGGTSTRASCLCLRGRGSAVRLQIASQGVIPNRHLDSQGSQATFVQYRIRGALDRARELIGRYGNEINLKAFDLKNCFCKSVPGTFAFAGYVIEPKPPGLDQFRDSFRKIGRES